MHVAFITMRISCGFLSSTFSLCCRFFCSLRILRMSGETIKQMRYSNCLNLFLTHFYQFKPTLFPINTRYEFALWSDRFRISFTKVDVTSFFFFSVPFSLAKLNRYLFLAFLFPKFINIMKKKNVILRFNEFLRRTNYLTSVKQ